MNTPFSADRLVVNERPLCPLCHHVHGRGRMVRFIWLGTEWEGQFDGARYDEETGDTVYLFARHRRDGTLSIIPVEGRKVLGYANERPDRP